MTAPTFSIKFCYVVKLGKGRYIINSLRAGVAYGLNHCLRCWCLALECQFECQLLSFWFSSLLRCLGKQQKMVQVLGPLPSMWETQWSSKFHDFDLAQPWALQSFQREPTMESLSHSSSVSFSQCISVSVLVELCHWLWNNWDVWEVMSGFPHCVSPSPRNNKKK